MKTFAIAPLFVAFSIFGAPITIAQEEDASFLQGGATGLEAKKGIEGKPAPPLSLSVDIWENLPEGKKFTDLNDYKGKVVIIKCFQSWCKRCHSEGFPILKKLVDKYKGDDRIQFIAIQTAFEGYTTNTDDKLAPTSKLYELDIPFGHSPKLEKIPSISSTYNTGGTPWWIVINQDGIVEYNGFDMDFEAAVGNIQELFDKNGG